MSYLELKIRQKGNPMLSTIVDSVFENEDCSDLVDAMFHIMYTKGGIGLAANQIGQPKRIIVMHAKGFKQEFINPVITKFYGGKATSKEGCLSVPGSIASKVNMIRYKQVIIEGFDKNWKPVKRKLKGLAAFCAQHEVDHLNGITI